MRDVKALDGALLHLAKSAKSGRRAKARLAEQLANMSPKRLQTISPEVFVALGPDGMKLFAQSKKNGSGLQPAKPPSPSLNKTSLLQRLSNLPWIRSASITLILITAGAVVGQTGGFAVDAGLLGPAHTYQGWPICSRLDLAADGCVYETRSDRLTIERIMAMTGLSAKVVTQSNPHIDFHYRLPAHTLLVVPGKRYH